MKSLRLLLFILCMAVLSTAHAEDKIMFLSGNHVLYRLDAKHNRYLLLPVEDRAEMSNIKVLANNNQVKTINVRLASEYADYYVPLDLSEFADHELVLDIHINGNIRNEGAIKEWACWKQMKYSDTFDMANRDKFRPEYHHTPAYGWMNDPNGMFYKDGTWHLYFQHNPYGSLWENMTWGHSSSKDLVHWKYEGDAIEPDALGTIFSGSAVVDKNNSAGFGKGAIVAMYTSAGESQTQSLAFSTDNGKTFTKYAANPVITSNVPDFRDPHMFWNDDIKKWNLILAAGQEMNIYTSDNLKDWKFESSFGHGYGNHNGVWECPDLMKLKVRGTNKDKWMLICNINPGGPFGGSATQYFVGDFDGHKFTCESTPDVTKWMDYGKDHYATVTFDNAPEGRHVAMAWMNNWQYAAQTPTMQYRSANSVPRDLDLFEYEGQTYCGVVPSKELLALRGKKQSKLSNACELVLNLKGSSSVTLCNDKGEKVVFAYDEGKRTFSMDRTKSGKVDFSEAFPVTTTAPVYGKLKQLRIFIDNSSIEVFDVDGKMAMTNLVFPITPYDKIVKKGKIKYAIYKM